MKNDIIIVSVLFIAIIIIALWFSSTPAYVPYSSTLISGAAKFEGFSPRMSPLEYSSATDNSALDGSIMNFAINGDKSDCKSVGGYNGYGVFCNPSSPPEKVDIYSQAKGSLEGQGYGYYNSQGSLQLDENMKKQLSTRGMNATGTPSVIAGSPL